MKILGIAGKLCAGVISVMLVTSFNPSVAAESRDSLRVESRSAGSNGVGHVVRFPKPWRGKWNAQAYVDNTSEVEVRLRVARRNRKGRFWWVRNTGPIELSPGEDVTKQFNTPRGLKTIVIGESRFPSGSNTWRRTVRAVKDRR